MAYTLALDAMGGDHGPREIIPAAFRALERHEGLQLLLAGREDALKALCAREPAALRARTRVLHAPEVVEMGEAPSAALRRKKQSSMRVALNQVKEGRAQACVSAGNTGALMAISRYLLKNAAGHRPAGDLLRPAGD